MILFTDQHGVQVSLAFKKEAFSIKPRHVLVICRYDDAWLLTKHPIRGLEFPGGKLEANETAEEAALREVYEETGAEAQITEYIGEYLVKDQERPFVKAVLFADVLHLHKESHYYETEGPVLIKGEIEKKIQGEEFSFIMKDEVVLRSLQKARELNLYE